MKKADLICTLVDFPSRRRERERVLLCGPQTLQINQGRLHKLKTTLDLLELAASDIEEEITSIYRPSSKSVSSIHHSVPSLCDGMRIQLLSISPQALSCLYSLLFTSIAEGFPHDH